MAPANASEVLSIKAFGLSFTHVLPLVLVFFILVALKRRYLSPIRDIPGPFLASFSGLWQILHIIKGHTELAVLDLHKQHGT